MSILQTVKKLLPVGMARDAWVTDNDMRGGKIARYRRYVDGDFDANLTDEMRNMLRLKAGAGNELAANWCAPVIQTMGDRLKVIAITAKDDTDTEWAEDILDHNRFDGLQLDVHESTLVDGDSFVFVGYDNDTQMPTLIQELAFDGVEGVLVIHDRSDRRKIICAIKVWQITRTEFADTLRINFFFEDRIERYFSPNVGGGALQAYTEDGQPAVLDWTMPDGSPIGVPVVQFSNRQRGNTPFGLSELESVTPLQDAINRNLHSMIMASELSAFQIRYVVGFKPPAALTPGMMISVNAGLDTTTTPHTPKTPSDGQIKWFDSIRFGSFEQGEIVPFLEQAKFLVDQIRQTTHTPNPEAVGTAASGESRKQAEIGLIGKCERFQVKAGNAWENVMSLAARVSAAFGVNRIPETTLEARWTCKWKAAELRDDTAFVANIMALKDAPEWVLKRTMSVTGLSEDDIETITKEREKKKAEDFRRGLQMATNTFNSQPNGQSGQNGGRMPANMQPQANGQAQ